MSVPPPAMEPAAKAAVAWTPAKVAATIGLFLLAGLAEIGGGWLMWQTLRNSKPWFYAVAGEHPSVYLSIPPSPAACVTLFAKPSLCCEVHLATGHVADDQRTYCATASCAAFVSQVLAC